MNYIYDLFTPSEVLDFDFYSGTMIVALAAVRNEKICILKKGDTLCTSTALARAGPVFETIENSDKVSCSSGGFESKIVSVKCMFSMASSVMMRRNGPTEIAMVVSSNLKPKHGLITSRIKCPN